MTRGAFIVLEGLDRSGKSTQVDLLVKGLIEHSIPAKKRSFPERSTTIGKLIDEYLQRKTELTPQVAHLLFSVNRWECKDSIIETLEKGTTLVVDRYAASGAAYGAVSTKQSLTWCKAPDKGLPAPDHVFFLDVPEDVQLNRASWGQERYECVEMQRKVNNNFTLLADPATWTHVNANRTPEEIHKDLLEKTVEIYETNKDKSIKTLYTDMY